jgi:hypothetical protein
MRELEITELYDNVDEDVASDFTGKIDSTMRVKTDYYKDENNLEWMDVFEELLPYVEKILRNPKRFIKTEEEIVKIESAKKVGVETVKHLAKHTNFIQDIDMDTGDVIPSKLLNVLKEETFNTYENRFIYTLINHLDDFIRKRLETLNRNPKLKDSKQIEYSSTTFVGDEKINVNINLNTDLDTKVKMERNFEARLKNIQDNIKDLKFTEVFKSLEKDRVPFVTPPIKKTNVILKNVNFQYAMNLWDYVHLHMGDKNTPKKQNKDYMDKGELRNLIDESFFLDYLTVNTLSQDEEEKQKSKEKTISKMLDKIINMNPELSKKELLDMLGIEFDKAQARRVASKTDIEKIFRKYIDRYLEREFTYV